MAGYITLYRLVGLKLKKNTYINQVHNWHDAREIIRNRLTSPLTENNLEFMSGEYVVQSSSDQFIWIDTDITWISHAIKICLLWL